MSDGFGVCVFSVPAGGGLGVGGHGLLVNFPRVNRVNRVDQLNQVDRVELQVRPHDRAHLLIAGLPNRCCAEVFAQDQDALAGSRGGGHRRRRF